MSKNAVKARVEVHSNVNTHKRIVMRTEQTQTLIDETQYESKLCGQIIIKRLKIGKFFTGIEDVTN